MLVAVPGPRGPGSSGRVGLQVPCSAVTKTRTSSSSLLGIQSGTMTAAGRSRTGMLRTPGWGWRSSSDASVRCTPSPCATAFGVSVITDSSPTIRSSACLVSGAPDGVCSGSHACRSEVVTRSPRSQSSRQQPLSVGSNGDNPSSLLRPASHGRSRAGLGLGAAKNSSTYTYRPTTGDHVAALVGLSALR